MSQGIEWILDPVGCDPGTFERPSIDVFLAGLCRRLRVEGCELHSWDYTDLDARRAAPAHLAGVTAVLEADGRHIRDAVTCYGDLP